MEQWRLSKRSEVSLGQGELFNAITTKPEENDAEPEMQTASYPHTKPKRKPLPNEMSTKMGPYQISPNAPVDIVPLAIRQPLLLSCLLVHYWHFL
jgi:hypothetical protein